MRACSVKLARGERCLRAFLPEAACVVLLALTVSYHFNLTVHLGLTLLENQFFYLVLALTLPFTFMLRPSDRDRASSRLIDYACTAGAAVAAGYFVLHAESILQQGWQFLPPTGAKIAAIALWGIALEGTRRAAGRTVAVIVGLVSLYPLVAGALPYPFTGYQSSLVNTAAYHAMSQESLIGIPFRAFAGIVAGFLLFGVVLQMTGGGQFFADLAFGLLGHVRGGPAKVAVISSGIMGSMSGSPTSNVLATGVVTIPAMKRTGFSATQAAAIEACASTGGVLMPPVMGAAAFVMATFVGAPYSAVVSAAIIPSVLYYLGLYVQIDAYAARKDIRGLPRAELPRVRDTLRTGWPYLLAFALLTYLLVWRQQEAIAPFYASALLLALNQCSPQRRWGLQDARALLRRTIGVFADLATILAGVGLLVGALSLTGLSATLANELVQLAGGNLYALLAVGAMTSFILGIGMTVTAAYLFLAVALAPALIRAGLDPMAAHMFILYWGSLSFITPPVALAAYTAAPIAGAHPLRTGLRAVRLGGVIYLLPFVFALNPALIGRGELWETAQAVGLTGGGALLLSAAIQGHPLLAPHRKLPLARPLAALIGLALLAIAAR